jgi:GH24 family phage-related lysozyme (muramidase)
MHPLNEYEVVDYKPAENNSEFLGRENFGDVYEFEVSGLEYIARVYYNRNHSPGTKEIDFRLKETDSYSNRVNKGPGHLFSVVHTVLKIVDDVAKKDKVKRFLITGEGDNKDYGKEKTSRADVYERIIKRIYPEEAISVYKNKILIDMTKVYPDIIKDDEMDRIIKMLTHNLLKISDENPDPYSISAGIDGSHSDSVLEGKFPVQILNSKFGKIELEFYVDLEEAFCELEWRFENGESGNKEFNNADEMALFLERKFSPDSLDEINNPLNELEQYLNEAFGSINESDEPSPTFEWDIAKEKIDKSKKGINTAEKAYEYLNWFLDKVKSLPKSIKLKLTKYTVMSLMVLLGAGAINGIVSDKAPEISQSIAIAISVPEEVPEIEVAPEKEVYSKPTEVSGSLISFLKDEEGSAEQKGEPVLTAYDNLGDGMVTIGYGHAERIESTELIPDVTTITRERADELLAEDIEDAKAGLDRLLGRWDEAGIEYNIDQGMYNAMTSMIFNMGIGNFLTSDFIQLVKSGDYEEAADKILTTNVSYLGHIPRRKEEKEMFTSGNNTQAQQIAMNEARKIVRSVLSENLQLADKTYFTPGLLSAEVRRILISEKMTGGDVWTKLVTDIYMAYLEQSDRQSEMIGNAILNKDEKDEPYVRETDVLHVETWREVRDLYHQLKSYNKNVFPISGFNINGVEDIWSLIRGLKQRATIIEEFKKLPSVATRNMKEDIRTPRSGNSMNSYRDQLQTFLAHYSQLGNRNKELQDVIHKKMFKKGVDLDDLMDFVEEKENLLGGATFDKGMVDNIIEESNELEKIYEQGTVMVVKVDGPYGIKEIGCNSLWCFTYGQGYDRNWSQYSYNDVVYAIIDFSEPADSPEFMYVLIKPVDWDTEDEDANEDVIFDMKNDGYYDARNLLDSVFSREKAKQLFTFDIEPEEPEEEEEDYEKEYVDPNQLAMFEVRKIVRKVLSESVIEETQTGQKDLEKFVNDIMLFLGKRIVKEYEHNALLDPLSPHLRFLPELRTGTMTGEGFEEMGEFVKNTSIKVIPTTTIGGNPETKGMLSYGRPIQNSGKEVFEIRLKYEDEKLDEINQMFAEKPLGEVSYKDVYFKIFYMFNSVLLHEVQHAYDAWRSKGKALDSADNKGFVDRSRKAKALARSKKYDDLTPEEIKAINDSYAEYQNLVHEINARYAQTMNKVRMTSLDDDWNHVEKPWKSVYSDFKTHFDGWSRLSDKMKKKLTRRLAKAFQESSDRISADTAKANEKEPKSVMSENLKGDDCNSFFDINSLDRYVEFEKPLYSMIAKRKTAKLVYISQKQYIYKIAHGFGGLSYDDVVDSGAVVKSNIDKYADAMLAGDKFPIGHYTKDGENQEGRHRALAAMKIGCEKIPVIQFMKISDKEFLNTVNRLKGMSFDELDGLFKKIGFKNGITQLGYNDLKRYVDYNLQENNAKLDRVRGMVRRVLKESVIEEIIEGEFNAYHGSPTKINKFTDDFVGGEKANDAQGAGIYFATNPEDASYYGDHIYKVIIKGNFLDRNAPIENVDVEELVKLIKMKDEWEMNAQDYSPDPEAGAYEAAYRTIEYNGDEAEAFQQIEADFYRYDSVDYVRNMTKLGYDGIIVDAPSGFVGDKHIIVFNPDAVTLTGKL